MIFTKNLLSFTNKMLTNANEMPTYLVKIYRPGKLALKYLEIY